MTASIPPRSKALQSRRTSSTLSLISDVVHPCAGLLGLALRHVRDRRALQLRAHLVGHLRPRRAKRFGAGSDLALEQLDDFEDGDLLPRLRERVAALDASLRLQHTAAPQRHEQRFEELRR